MMKPLLICRGITRRERRGEMIAKCERRGQGFVGYDVRWIGSQTRSAPRGMAYHRNGPGIESQGVFADTFQRK